MLFTLGERTKSGDVMALLLDCHHRVREHLALARRLANAPVTSAPESVRAAAARIRSYFGIAFPRHREDEEVDIFPRLLGLDEELDAAIARLTSDHEAHEQCVSTLVAICEELERDPSLLRARALDLAEAARCIDSELTSHILLEERTVFPAIGRLPALDREQIHERMRARR